MMIIKQVCRSMLAPLLTIITEKKIKKRFFRSMLAPQLCRYRTGVVNLCTPGKKKKLKSPDVKAKKKSENVEHPSALGFLLRSDCILIFFLHTFF